MAVKPERLVCPACQSAQLIRKGKRYRRIQPVPIGFQPVVLKTEVPQCKCQACGKTFEVSPPFFLPSPMCTTPRG